MPSTLVLFPLLNLHFKVTWVYKASKDSNGCVEFYELIVKHFRDAGLNTNNPSHQNNFKHPQYQEMRNMAEDSMNEHW
ncbi:MAG: hypothetical protein KAH18_12060 [Psychromonas sp.]|nr:hypothetical protein [Psychromonas sp.]